MDSPPLTELKPLDLNAIAQLLKISTAQVEATAKLLDGDNTIPFLAKYRRDQTDGLYESQIRRVKELINRYRLLNERKIVIRKSIDNQGALTEEISTRIDAAATSRELEDIYLPFKPQKQTQAEIARQKGLEPLARDLLEATVTGDDLPSRAEQFVRVDKGLDSIEDVIEGVHHLLAEAFAQNVEVRRLIRQQIKATGVLISKTIENTPPPTPVQTQKLNPSTQGSAAPKEPTQIAGDNPALGGAAEESPSDLPTQSTQTLSQEIAPGQDVNPDADEPAHSSERAAEPDLVPPAATQSDPDVTVNHEVHVPSTAATPTGESGAKATEVVGQDSPQAAQHHAAPVDGTSKSKKKKRSKDKPANKKENPFAEFANFREKIKSIPPHRILAINRGERAGRLKVAIESTNLSIEQLIDEAMVGADHPFKDVLTKAAKDSLTKTIIPAVEREIRRDLTETAESHAVRVFAKNLRQLLIQRPVPPQRILAIDPGFRTGCKVAVIDETGRPLETGRFFIVGKADRLVEGRALLTRLIGELNVSLIAIGNGSGCRITEQLVSELLANELKESSVRYTMMNQAGASAYATSELAREELPDYDPVFRSAISIGRRALDPLSELVKIHPSNIGVGMYQHDVKAKHLQDSLDAEIESSVNFVGVDLNRASVALLRHIAGLNQMKARRIVEHRDLHGPFKNRMQLMEVQGIGEKTFIQCAGFLRIFDGEEPLDATPIHPESYEVAKQILAKVGSDPQGLIDAANQYSRQSENEQADAGGQPNSDWQLIRRKVRELDMQQIANELSVGKLLVDDIARCMLRPSRDPRHDFHTPVQRRSMLSVDELEVNKELRGQIVNVVDFGVFVDIGLGASSLIHVSQLSEKFIHDLHLTFSIGDVLTMWVTEIDKVKKQVKLTAVRPKELPSLRPTRSPKHHGDRKPKHHRSKSEKRTYERKPKKPSAPPPPITQEMVEGKKPMRSFSDLMQFFDKRDD